MGREGENLPLARASRPSAADAGKASGAALVGLLALYLFAVFAQRFVNGLLFSDMLRRLSSLILPYL